MSKEYQLIPTRQFRRDFDQLPPRIQRRVLQAVEKIKRQPDLGQSLVNRTLGRWKWSVDDYKIRYDIQGDEIKLHLVRHRSEFRN